LKSPGFYPPDHNCSSNLYSALINLVSEIKGLGGCNGQASGNELWSACHRVYKYFQLVASGDRLVFPWIAFCRLCVETQTAYKQTKRIARFSSRKLVTFGPFLPVVWPGKIKRPCPLLEAKKLAVVGRDEES
jgi:hypothetical protein